MAVKVTLDRGLALAGLASLSLSAGLGFWHWSWTHTASRVEGVVVNFEVKPSDNHFVYAPIVHFETAGQLRSVTGDVASFPAAYEVGERVGVLVDVEDADRIAIDSIRERYFLTLLLGGLGVLLTIAAGIVHFQTRPSSVQTTTGQKRRRRAT